MATPLQWLASVLGPGGLDVEVLRERSWGAIWRVRDGAGQR